MKQWLTKSDRFWIGVTSGTVSFMLTVGIATGLLLHGCQTAPVKPPPDARPGLVAAIPLVRDSTKDVGDRAGAIDDAAGRYNALLEPAQRLVWTPYHRDINTATAALRVDQGRLETAPPAMASAVKAEDQLRADLANRDKQIAELKTDRDSALRGWVVVGIVVGGVLLALSVPFFIEGNVTGGLVVAGIGSGLIAVASVLLEYERTIAFIGLAAAVVGVIVVVVKHAGASLSLTNLKADFATFSTDMTQFGEWCKQEFAAVAPASLGKLFGIGVTPGIAHTVQSPATQATVKAVRTSGAIDLAFTSSPSPVPSVVPTAAATTEAVTPKSPV